VPPFHYRHLGSFAFIGADNAVLEVPLNQKKPSGFTGFLTGLLWKGLESYEQISLKVRSAAPRKEHAMPRLRAGTGQVQLASTTCHLTRQPMPL